MTLLLSLCNLVDNAAQLPAISTATGADIGMLRFVITFFLGFPIAFLERILIVNYKIRQSEQELASNLHLKKIHNLLHGLLGFFFLYYNFREDCLYVYFSIVVNYFIIWINRICTKTLRIPFSSTIFTIISWVFQIGFYLYGINKAYGDSLEYKINWLMPGCVMLLKNLALFTDCSDGLLPDEKIKPDRKDAVIRDYPDPLELIGFTTLYTSVMIGPQMTLSHYRKFVDCIYIKNYGEKFHMDTLKIAVIKLLFGTLLVAFFQINAHIHDDTLWNSEKGEFYQWPFMKKVIFITIYGNCKYLRYMSFWNLVESGIILSGASTVYEKIHRTDKEKTYHNYNQTNANIVAIFKGVKMNDYIAHYNINTNKWCFVYLFKRLAFLGNKDLSQLITLMFLATWHGTWMGYYSAFFYEFCVINTEKSLASAGYLQDHWIAPADYKGNKMVYFVRGTLQKVFWFGLHSGYCMIDFSLLDFKVYWPVYKSIYFYGHIVLALSWIVILAFGKKKKIGQEKKDN